VIPGVTGAGLGVRAAAHADDAVRAVKGADKVVDAARAGDRAADAAKAAEHVGDAAKGVQQAGGAAKARPGSYTPNRELPTDKRGFPNRMWPLLTPNWAGQNRSSAVSLRQGNGTTVQTGNGLTATAAKEPHPLSLRDLLEAGRRRQ
jgi:hypothetical protein